MQKIVHFKLSSVGVYIKAGTHIPTINIDNNMFMKISKFLKTIFVMVNVTYFFILFFKSKIFFCKQAFLILNLCKLIFDK